MQYLNENLKTMKNIYNNPFLLGSAMFTISVVLCVMFEPGTTGPAEALAILATFASSLVFFVVGLTRKYFKDPITKEHEHWIN